MTLFKPAKPIKKNSRVNDKTISDAPHSKYPTQLVAYAILLGICILLFEPLISTLSANAYDYVTHLKWAADMENGQKLILPHPLYHLLAIFTKKTFAISYPQSSTLVIVLSIFFLAVLNYNILKTYTSTLTAIFFSICLLIITPLQLFFAIDQHLYFGYIGISIYHSPTMLLLKPLSLLAFCYTLKSVDNPQHNTLTNGLALALALFLSGISKPSFLMIVLPAFVLFLLITRQLKSALMSKYIYFAFFLPIVGLLGLQFFQTFFFQDLSQGTGTPESHIVVLPFETMAHYSDFLFPKLILSIAFPLLTFLFYPRAFIQDKAVVFSCCCLLMGLVLTYLFAESGSRMYDGNFWWSGQIGLYLVFLFSVAFLFKNRQHLTIRNVDKVKYSLSLMLFFLHALFGIFFYKQELFFNAKFW
ncbi:MULTISPECIES: hypothetical protein [Pseudomonas]|uniref:hypothetical protein n=1 Tax=Pseudomonas TaxID=286 RepID=UPI000811FF26|nr:MULTISPECIES: hypothetical protein [Pseudomonas]RZI25417.1 hypothetical protein EUX53_08355 [Pseudomonas orientalis]CRM06295.1 hypothetical protein [Pseudomonas sp. 28 E 9]